MYETDFEYVFKEKESFEQKLAKHKHTMELVRTVIGVIVLTIQIIILYNLLTK